MTDTNSAPFIKHEPDDQVNPNQFMMTQNTFGMPSPASFGNQFGNSGGNDGVDPSDLTMQTGGFMSNAFSSTQNLSSSFNFGNSAIETSELLDLDFSGQNGMSRENSMGMIPEQRQPAGISMSHQGQMSHIYSETPDGAPIQSPFLRGSFNYDQFRPVPQQHTPHASSPHMNNIPFHRAGFPNSSDARSPMTPKTPALGGLNIGTPESGSFPSQPIRVGSLQHHKSLSVQWDGTPGSAQSFIESPISSPGQPHHLGISEILRSGKHASLPTKVDTHHSASTQAALESQEAKRRRRRASHNMVERRRRDNINERIQDLSHLVPHHRLEDDKIRKQLMNNSALATGTGLGSNAATSLLAGSGGRRATAGNITMGLPIEEKEKGPNKGDILNGAVAWTRDLMWALHRKIEQEDQLAEYIASLGGTWPFEQTEEDKRMRTELLDAMEKNDPSTFSYSRAPGSGLRVPKHTNIAGEPLQPPEEQQQQQQQQQQRNGTLSPQNLSPGYHNGGSGTSSGNSQPQFWNSAGHAGISFKEEDEYTMDMN
ncbi:hypothetical protein VTO42DRAFT_4200 [Malbranchea cinnamomea]